MLFTSRFITTITMALGLSSGCVTRGQDFSSDVSWLKVKKTTQAEITKTLGAPERVGSSGGTPTWTYGYYDWSLFGDSNTKELKLYFNPDKTLNDFSFSSSFPVDRSRELGVNR